MTNYDHGDKNDVPTDSGNADPTQGRDTSDSRSVGQQRNRVGQGANPVAQSAPSPKTGSADDSITDADVRAVVAALASERSYVKPRDVATELGVPSTASTHSIIGQALARLDAVERWSSTDGCGGSTWEVVDEVADPEIRTDGGELTGDETLRLTDDGLELPDWLRGYTGTFTVQTGNIDGDMETTDAGMPDVEFYDGPIAVMPEAGDYNEHIPDGHMVLTAPGKPEWCYEIIDERSEESEPEIRTDGGEYTPTDLYADALDTWGEGLQVAVAIEELSELTTDLARTRRGTRDISMLAEELADAQIVLEQLTMMVGRDAVEAERDRKLERLECLLADAQSADSDGGDE